VNSGKKEKILINLDHDRIIPSNIKLEVWKRDRGKCVICGKTDNLHFDHIIPFSKGGSSLVQENIQLLCARHNMEKRDKIE
jgi:5-methylcytosine-specific restriction endonuclease McrA